MMHPPIPGEQLDGWAARQTFMQGFIEACRFVLDIIPEVAREFLREHEEEKSNG